MILHFPGLLKLWLQNEIYAINFIKIRLRLFLFFFFFLIVIISKWFFGFEPKYKFQLPLKVQHNVMICLLFSSWFVHV